MGNEEGASRDRSMGSTAAPWDVVAGARITFYLTSATLQPVPFFDKSPCAVNEIVIVATMRVGFVNYTEAEGT